MPCAYFPCHLQVVYLCPEEYPETNLRFLEEEGITLHHLGMTGEVVRGPAVCFREEVLTKRWLLTGAPPSSK